MLDYTITRTDNPTSAEKLSEILANPGFGKHFTDHMVTIDWTEDKGWHDAQVRPYGPMTMDPASNVFHYGQAIFEGIKAYRQPDDSIATFRPDHNAQRFINSAQRLAMPELPQEEFIESLRQLVEVDKAWVPEAGGEAALYLRPFMISTEVSLGVHPAKSYRYVLIASPVGSYFSGGIKPVSVWLSTDYVRAAPGGTGAANIKSHHNVGGLPDDLQFKLIEPLRALFKDEVRQVGRELGVPDPIVDRQPFPGPGLGFRIIGEVTETNLDILRRADAIAREELTAAGLVAA